MRRRRFFKKRFFKRLPLRRRRTRKVVRIRLNRGGYRF